ADGQKLPLSNRGAAAAQSLAAGVTEAIIVTEKDSQWICESFFIGSLWQGRGEKRVLRENFLKNEKK
uniref:hypothetical protein n=1 Tax=Gemmiger formicilis TaxID=745368 RepID=UPI00402654B6